MKCLKCNKNTPDGSFCAECGASLNPAVVKAEELCELIQEFVTDFDKLKILAKVLEKGIEQIKNEDLKTASSSSIELVKT